MTDLSRLRTLVLEKQTLEQALSALQTELDTLSRDIPALTEAVEEAQSRAEKLQGISLTGLLHALTGRLDSTRDAARAEAVRAKSTLDSALSRQTVTEQRIAERNAALAELDHVEQAYYQAMFQSENAARLPGHNRLLDTKEAVSRLQIQQAALQQSLDAAAALQELIHNTALISRHGESNVTNTGVRYNTRLNTLERQLPQCQAQLNSWLSTARDLPASPCGIEIELNRLSAYEGDRLISPATDFALNGNLDDAEYQLIILKKQLRKATDKTAQASAAETAMFRSLLLQFHDAMDAAATCRTD